MFEGLDASSLKEEPQAWKDPVSQPLCGSLVDSGGIYPGVEGKDSPLHHCLIELAKKSIRFFLSDGSSSG